MGRLMISFLAVLTFAAPVSVRGMDDEVDRAYQDFIAGRYGPAFRSLFDYRRNHEGTLRVDFMLAVSGCRLDSDFRILGGLLLARLPKWYNPLSQGHLADIQRQAAACPDTGVSEQIAIARVDAKYDDPSGPPNFNSRSNAGKDQPLPRVAGGSVTVPPPTAMMSPLATGRGYMGGTDYRNVKVASAPACSQLCANESQCVAMTFDATNGMCWLKNRLTELVPSGNFTSAYKLMR